MAAVLQKAGYSMLARIGRGVERRVPEMSRMVEFNCTLTSPVWEDRYQTGAQYSATQ